METTELREASAALKKLPVGVRPIGCGEVMDPLCDKVMVHITVYPFKVYYFIVVCLIMLNKEKLELGIAKL